MKNDLRILVKQEGEYLVAQCVEYDICTQATDYGQLQRRMDTLIDVELAEAKELGVSVPPAPEGIEKIWQESLASEGRANNYRMVDHAA